MENNMLYPVPSKAQLQALYVGKTLGDVPTPAAVLDRAVVKRNCSQILETCKKLKIQFRPHVKTHKTIEGTRLQVGHESKNVNLVVSTVNEVEYLLPFLLECKGYGRSVNVLYGLPLPPSQIYRLAALGAKLGQESISVMIDHLDQLRPLAVFKAISGFEIGVFIKVNTGYGRAGVSPLSNALTDLIKEINVSENKQGYRLEGLYSHAGHSYGVSSKSGAAQCLHDEITGLHLAVNLAKHVSTTQELRNRRFTLSVGATPSATSIQTLAYLRDEDKGIPQIRLKELIEDVATDYTLEVHAGVYPFLDMQQLATKASPSATHSILDVDTSSLSYSDIALTILAEVASEYSDREPVERLIAAGSLALGREPCKSYDGWGIVSDWGHSPSHPMERATGWKVARVSQEHGILQPISESGLASGLKVGQKIMIWPNHACIAGAGFGFYLVVDSDGPDDARDKIVDVWVRCRGW